MDGQREAQMEKGEKRWTCETLCLVPFYLITNFKKVNYKTFGKKKRNSGRAYGERRKKMNIWNYLFCLIPFYFTKIINKKKHYKNIIKK